MTRDNFIDNIEWVLGNGVSVPKGWELVKIEPDGEYVVTISHEEHGEIKCQMASSTHITLSNRKQRMSKSYWWRSAPGLRQGIESALRDFARDVKIGRGALNSLDNKYGSG